MQARNRNRVIAALAIATAFSLSPSIVSYWLRGTRLPSPSELVLLFPLIGVPLAVFTAVVRWRERGSPTTFRLAIGYVMTAVTGALTYAALGLPNRIADPGEPMLDPTTSALLGAYNSLLVVGIWALVYQLPTAAALARDQAREREALRRSAEQARLRATLEPHFVVNTLNAIAGLVHEDPDQARERIADLGDLLRDVVRLSDTTLHPLADEIRWLERYTRILVARHDGRLAVRWDIAPASRGVRIPVLILQPLVENAIQHGALRRPGGGAVSIATRAAGERWACTISDDGPGFDAVPRPGAQGLALTRRRLAAEWPGATMAIATGGDGTRIELAWATEAA